MNHKIAVLIMAAGKASRFGSCKQLLGYGDSTLLQHLIDQVNAVFDPQADSHTFVVTGCYHQEIAEQIKHTQLIYHPHWERGLGASIAFGVSALSQAQQTDYHGILVLLADQIAIDSQQLNKILTDFDGNSIVCAHYDEANGVPALFPRSYFAQLQRLTGDKGAKRLLNDERADRRGNIISITMPEAGIDIDRPNDYQHFIANANIHSSS